MGRRMSGRPILTEIVSTLGTPPEPFGWRQYLVLFGFGTALIAYLAIDSGLSRLFSLFVARFRHDDEETREPPAEGS